jgi:hypothetical protein
MGGSVVDWGRVLGATGEVPRGLSEVAIISDWLEQDDERAFISIVTHVSASSTGEVDRLDAALLSFAKANPDPEVRLRLIKFYALFKITEMQCYHEFRGFPQ